MAQFDAEYRLSNIMDGVQGFRVDGAAFHEYLGSAVSSGDVNGDGFADLIIGAQGQGGGGNGGGYVIYGAAGGFSSHFDVSTLVQATGVVLNGGSNELMGRHAGYLGDINGDGIGDYAFSSQFAGGGDGRAYFVFGSASGSATPIDLTALTGSDGFTINGAATAVLGASVSGIGDINKDGIADFAVGAIAGNGDTYVVLGKNTAFGATFDVTTLNGANGFKVHGIAASDDQGISVSSAGDFNGDGVQDLLVSSFLANPSARSDAGAVYVIYGNASGFAGTAGTINLSTMTTAVGITISGAAANNNLGASVHSAGDVNGDGFDDLIIGMPYGPGDTATSGAAYVIYGKASQTNIDLASFVAGTTGFKLNGVANGDKAGISVAGGGDVNGDGYADVIVGARAAVAHGFATGAAYVVYGSATGVNVDLGGLINGDGSTGFQLSGENTNYQTGGSVAMADVNGDGLSDLVIGAQLSSDHDTFAGSTYTVFGKESTTAVNLTGTNASQTLVGSELNDTLNGLNGNDTIYGNGGDDLITGGLGNDNFFGGAGNDGFAMKGFFNAQDKIDGGAGTNDQIGLEGDYSGGVTLDGANIKGIEVVAMLQGFDYTISTLDNLVATGQTFTFWSASMGQANRVSLDASLETDASYHFFMGQGFDQATGGGGADLFYGEGSQDTMTGGGGADIFAYLQVSDSTGDNNFNANDRITDFVHGTDKIKLPFAVAAVDAPITVGGGSNGTANADLEAAVTTLALHHAVLYTPNSGDAFNAGKTFLIVDANGVAGYQHGADYLIDVTGGTLAGLSVGDFTT